MEILALLLFSLCWRNAHYADIMLDADRLKHYAPSYANIIYLNFSNSLMIHKGNKCLISVWKSDEKLLIFASLISPSRIILFEK